MVRREHTYLIFTTSLDILTDLLIISVPFALLWTVKLSLRRKLALFAVLSLSAFMIAIAIVRVALSSVASKSTAASSSQAITDTVWLFFWQSIEAAIAIIMVSVTAFRSMLGQKQHSTSSGSHSQSRNVFSDSRRRTAAFTGGEKLPSGTGTKDARRPGSLYFVYPAKELSTMSDMSPSLISPKVGSSRSGDFEGEADSMEMQSRGESEKSSKIKVEKAESFV